MENNEECGLLHEIFIDRGIRNFETGNSCACTISNQYLAIVCDEIEAFMSFSMFMSHFKQRNICNSFVYKCTSGDSKLRI